MASSDGSSSRTESILSNTLVSVPDAIYLHQQTGGTVKFVDGTLWMDPSKSARNEFAQGPRIANAVFLDALNKGNPGGLSSGIPPTLPLPVLHAATMDALGISIHDHLIVYANQGCGLAYFRSYVHLSAMGHPPDQCHLLDGSLQDWIAASGPTEESGTPPSTPPVVLPESLLSPSSSFQPSYPATNPTTVVTTSELNQWIRDDAHTKTLLVVDARSSGGYRNGHVPGAISLPASELLDPNHHPTSKLKPANELERILQASGVLDPQPKTIVSTCMMGVAACVLLVALDVLGKRSDAVYLYDGSWYEWNKTPGENPVEKG